MVLPALAVVVALVVQDQAPLRSSAHDEPARQTALTPGDWLEVRGERQGYLQVYDHRRERPGYVRPAAVRSYTIDESAAPTLAAIVQYLRDAPGQESLGIGYAALYLRAAPPQGLAGTAGADVFDAIGTMADRLARRASARVAKAGDATLAEQIAAAESYGVGFVRSEEEEGRTRVCYDGEAFRRVLALGGTGAERAQAALALTDPRCDDATQGSTAAREVAKWRVKVLRSVEAGEGAAAIPADTMGRLRLRGSSVQAQLAYFAARTGDAALAREASEAARRDLQLVDRSALADEDRIPYEEAALRVATVRWAAEPDGSPGRAASGLDVELAAGAPGQTCVRVRRRGATSSAAPFEHCTYGFVWPSSIRVAPQDAAVAMVVQPMVGWSELLVLHPTQQGWTADAVTPAAVDPELGYVEPAGFSPDGTRLLAVREARASGPLGSPHTLAPWIEKRFQVVAVDGMRVEKQSPSRAGNPAFKRWESPEWARGTLALR